MAMARWTPAAKVSKARGLPVEAAGSHPRSFSDFCARFGTRCSMSSFQAELEGMYRETVQEKCRYRLS